jgi:hypothetical protein
MVNILIYVKDYIIKEKTIVPSVFLLSQQANFLLKQSFPIKPTKIIPHRIISTQPDFRGDIALAPFSFFKTSKFT